MTTKTLTGTYSSGYSLQSPITTLSIASSGYVEGTGVTTPGSATVAYTVVNQGRIVCTDTTTNFAGIYLTDGGLVTNGGTGDLTAEIYGTRAVRIANAAGTVNNYGSIIADQRLAVYLVDGGVINNGSAADTTAQMKTLGRGKDSVAFGSDAPGTINNFGAIDATSSGYGVDLVGGGRVTNGGPPSPPPRSSAARASSSWPPGPSPTSA